MNRLSFCGFASLAALLFLFAVPAVRAETAEEAVSTLIQKMKSSGSITPMVEQIDWESRFKELSDEEKAARHFRNPEDMKRYYLERAKANGADSVAKLEQEQKKNPAAGGSLALVRNELERQQAESKNQLLGTSYKILKSEKQDDGKTVVSVRKTLGNFSEDIQLSLRPSGSSWVIENGGALNPAPSKLNGGSPIGRLPEPVAVLGQP
jgi:hypothetical protein